MSDQSNRHFTGVEDDLLELLGWHLEQVCLFDHLYRSRPWPPGDDRHLTEKIPRAERGHDAFPAMGLLDDPNFARADHIQRSTGVPLAKNRRALRKANTKSVCQRRIRHTPLINVPRSEVDRQIVRS